MGVGRFFVVRDVMSGIIGDIDQCSLIVTIFVFSDGCKSGSCDLIRGNNIAVLVTMNIDRPY